MDIETRLQPGFECYLNDIESGSNVNAEPGNRYILSKNFVVQLPNVDNCQIGAYIGVRQLVGVGTIVDRFSHYNSVGSINHTYKVPAGTEVILKLFHFSGWKKWMIVCREDLAQPFEPVTIIPAKSKDVEVVYRQGEPGKPGRAGGIGSRGRTGKPGRRGFKGLPGPPGKRGLRGRRGEKGDPGKRGNRGYTGAAGVNANSISRFHFPGEVIFTDDLYSYHNNFTYRYFGKPSKIKRIMFQIGYNNILGQPIIDVLINEKESALKSPLRLPTGNDVFLEPDTFSEIIVTDGDEITFPCIMDECDAAEDLMIIIEFEIIT